MKQVEKGTKGRAAVLGLGVTGIAAVKNLREAGFDVVGFEQNAYIGGLWQWHENPKLTTVLKSTKANISKQRNCYPDFPFPDDVPSYPSAADFVKYLSDYVDHFELRSHFRLSHKVDRLAWLEQEQQWTVKLTEEGSKPLVENFDKVVVTTGAYHRAICPDVEGADQFKGKIMHAQAYKDPAPFAGKCVVVVGLSNTGGDTAVDLCQTASQVYMSHRSGARILSRVPEGQQPMDNRISRRLLVLGMAFSNLFPRLSDRLSSLAIERGMRKNIQPSWNLLPAPPIRNAPPVMNDYVLSRFADGKIISKPGIKRVFDRSVEFTDGSTIDDIEAIIFATGYEADYSILSPEADPTAFETPEWDRAPHVNGLRYARLYQGLLSTAHPTSLAFIGPFRGHSFAIFGNADLSSTAVAQVFAGNHLLPLKSEIESWCDTNYARNLKRISKWRISKIECDAQALEKWLNTAAGNAVNEKLGWGIKGWKFWWNDRALYKLVIDGIDTPFLYRLFEGKKGDGTRKPWEGARAAIEKVNQAKY